MKKNTGLKWITLIILVVAGISLVFGSVIMLLGNSEEQTASGTSLPEQASTQE